MFCILFLNGTFNEVNLKILQSITNISEKGVLQNIVCKFLFSHVFSAIHYPIMQGKQVHDFFKIKNTHVFARTVNFYY